MSIASEITRLQTAKAAIKAAIETKGVTVPSATLLSGYDDLIAAIQTGGGGGGSGLVKTLVATTASERTLQGFLAANPVPLKYRSGVVLLTIEASTAPSQGSGTANFVMFFYHYANSAYTKLGMITNYKTTLDAPNNMNINTAVANAENFFEIFNDCITSNNSTNKARYFPAGATFSKIDIPFDLATRTIDETEV